MDITPNQDEIDAEAQRWVIKIGDPNATKADLGALDAWLLDPAHAQVFERHMEAAKARYDTGLGWPTYS